jgi:hypothetical protein
MSQSKYIDRPVYPLRNGVKKRENENSVLPSSMPLVNSGILVLFIGMKHTGSDALDRIE